MKFAVEYRDKKQQQVESRTSRIMLKRNDGISSSNKRANNWILIERHCIKLNHANIFYTIRGAQQRSPPSIWSNWKENFFWQEKRDTNFIRARCHLIIGGSSRTIFLYAGISRCLFYQRQTPCAHHIDICRRCLCKRFFFLLPRNAVIAFDKFSFDEWNKCHRRQYFLSTLNSPN